MISFRSILESLSSTLNTDFFPNNILNNDIRIHLLSIANTFISHHEIPKAAVKDIVLTGSMANYNYSSTSDVDLHILLDTNYLSSSSKSKYFSELLHDSSSLWNLQHDIPLDNHEVEIYLQDAEDSLHAKGIYSVLKDKWILHPSKISPSSVPSDSYISLKAKSISRKIEYIISLYNNSNFSLAYKLGKLLKDKIRDYRQLGLTSKNEEFSIENLVFKKLRNLGLLDKLKDITRSSYDRLLSIPK